MKIALLDLGSNTIKMAAYQLDGGSFQQIYYHATFAYVIGFVENNRLSDEGVDKIIATICYYKKAAALLGCDRMDCFSTASLRFIDNRDAVIDEVERQTRLRIQAISGEQEAYYNFLSMKLIAGEDSFVGGDLGGGSLQLFACQNGQLAGERSFPLGALKLYKQFVQGDFPTKAEADALCAFVRETLEASGFYTDFTNETLYFMGGTVRMIAGILDKKTGNFTKSDLDALTERFLNDWDYARAEIMRTVPERLHTILPGMLVIGTACAYLGCTRICYTQNSVREGYLLEHYLKA